MSADRAAGPGDEPRRPMERTGVHIATTASRSFSAAAPFAAGSESGSSAADWTSFAYSFLERPLSISSDATTTSVFQCRLRHCQVRPGATASASAAQLAVARDTRYPRAGEPQGRYADS
jgi:hypothetical protein